MRGLLDGEDDRASDVFGLEWRRALEHVFEDARRIARHLLVAEVGLGWQNALWSHLLKS